MTPEDRALQALDGFYVNKPGRNEQTPNQLLVERVAAVIREAENDALERAAQLCDGHLHGTAALIRVLKLKRKVMP